MHRYAKEVGANEDLLALLINSLEDWDNKMQIECAQGFLAPIKHGVSLHQSNTLSLSGVQLLNKENRQRLLKVTVEIVNNEHNENDQLKESWIAVFDSLVSQIDFDYVKLVALKVIQEMTERKSSFGQRKLGIKLLTSLINQCGEAAMDDEILILKMLMSICRDSNYKIRMDAAIFMKEYLAANSEKLLKSTRLLQTYVPELIEMCTDEQTCIRIEAIEALCYVFEVV